jgi:tetratricopeptide (TPR) repeat protein
MPNNNKTEEFLQKLAPCIERGDLDACVEEAARVAREMGIGAEELVNLSAQMIGSEKFEFAYVLALATEQGLEGQEKIRAYGYAGIAAQFIEKAEEYYKKVIDLNPENSVAHFLLACLLLFYQQNRLLSEAKEHLEKAIKYDSKNAMAHTLYSMVLFIDNKIEDSRK